MKTEQLRLGLRVRTATPRPFGTYGRVVRLFRIPGAGPVVLIRTDTGAEIELTPEELTRAGNQL